MSHDLSHGVSADNEALFINSQSIATNSVNKQILIMKNMSTLSERVTKCGCACRKLLVVAMLFCVLPALHAQQVSGERYLSLKTNLAAWAGTIMNVSADIQTGKHFSLELPLLWCPWHISDQHSVRTFTFQPEARYWLSKPGQGHFFGLHAHVGWFNAKWNDRRYQDAHRPLLGAGISYGYLLPLNDRWAAEFTMGLGYANLKYDTYYNIANGVRLDTQTKNYWGITRVGLSLVYRFNTTK